MVRWSYWQGENFFIWNETGPSLEDPHLSDSFFTLCISTIVLNFNLLHRGGGKEGSTHHVLMLSYRTEIKFAGVHLSAN